MSLSSSPTSIKNPKSELQELLQKHNTTTPSYITIQCEYSTEFYKKPMFMCELTVQYEDGDFLVRSGGVYESKKTAQIHAAKNALKYIHAKMKEKYKLTPENFPLEFLKNIIVFIDYENYADDQQINLFKKSIPNVFKVVNKNHPKVSLADIITNSTRSDASDILITCKTAEAFITNPKALIFIITRDHFADVLDDLYETCFHVTSVEECFCKIKQEGARLMETLIL